MKNNINQKISKATLANWEKLGISDPKSKLSSRANKKLSQKHIVPIELFNNFNI